MDLALVAAAVVAVTVQVLEVVLAAPVCQARCAVRTSMEGDRRVGIRGHGPFTDTITMDIIIGQVRPTDMVTTDTIMVTDTIDTGPDIDITIIIGRVPPTIIGITPPTRVDPLTIDRALSMVMRNWDCHRSLTGVPPLRGPKLPTLSGIDPDRDPAAVRPACRNRNLVSSVMIVVISLCVCVS